MNHFFLPFALSWVRLYDFETAQSTNQRKRQFNVYTYECCSEFPLPILRIFSLASRFWPNKKRQLIHFFTAFPTKCYYNFYFKIAKRLMETYINVYMLQANNRIELRLETRTD